MLELTAQTSSVFKVSKDAKTRNRYNQVQLDPTNESQEVSPFPAGDHHKAQNDDSRWSQGFKEQTKQHNTDEN